MTSPLDQKALAQVFTDARTAYKFTNEPVTDETLHALHELLKWGPTSANCQPMRLVFVRSPEAKAKLREGLAAGNVDKTMAAPVTAIIAFDTKFFELMPKLFPARPTMGEVFEKNAALAQETALRNSSLQGAYLILAARMLGLAAGPMSGFDKPKVNAAFFSDGRFEANFLVNLGYADPAGNMPRQPRLTFEEAARIE